ncbi:MAG: 30S ribosomal protein S12 methylthiotransferase RimO [Bacteroidales bacterium]|nr:30S ribosomal protein S12 methylthiotransferase RimO [Bacteroidales bacterium]
MKRRSQKINVITLGCSKNLVDSEVLMRQIEEQGIEVVHNVTNSDAGIVIINSCGFIQDAKQESIDTILEYVRKKEEGRLEQLFVMGCLSERYKSELGKEIPEVDQYFGVNDIRQVINRLGGDLKKELLGERKLATPGHYAYLKISEGCDRKCSFCAIPIIRGRQQSKTIELIVKETEFLVEKGVRELILIAQDLTAYGTDLNGKRELPRLLEALAGVSGLPWIRLHYTYPAAFPEEVLYQIRDFDNICNYLDIPFQHISDRVLANMHRGINRKETLELIDKIRSIIPEAAIRTTLLTGHPGEGEKEFSELKDFIQEVHFERLGVFSYSEEEGTWGATNLQDDIPEAVKQERLEELMQIQQSISLEINEKRVGDTKKVLIDRKEGDYFIGRTEFDSPEVDNEVLIETKNALAAGDFVDVTFTRADAFDLYGRI